MHMKSVQNTLYKKAAHKIMVKLTSYYVLIFFCQKITSSQTVILVKVHKTLSYQKAVHKMLVKLSTGLSSPGGQKLGQGLVSLLEPP
jgi:hypothetical protein